MGRKGVTVVLVAGGLVAAFLSGKAMAAPSLPTQAEASVVRVVDGDTLVASIGGTDTTVRLLNIDTPETKDPTAPAECLGAEATDYLSDLLAPGDRIELSFDQVRLDPYGRTLAGVHHDGQLVNAEIARAGFGVAVLFEPNRRFYPEVLRAQEEAAGRSVGLFAPTVDCSVAGQLESSTTEATDAATTTVTTVQQADAALAHVDDVLLRGLVLAKALDVERDVVRRAVLTALSSAHRHAHQSALDALRKQANRSVRVARSSPGGGRPQGGRGPGEGRRDRTLGDSRADAEARRVQARTEACGVQARAEAGSQAEAGGVQAQGCQAQGCQEGGATQGRQEEGAVEVHRTPLLRPRWQDLAALLKDQTDSGLCPTGTRSPSATGPGGVPLPKGRPPIASRPCSLSKPSREGPTGTMPVGFTCEWTTK